MEKYKELSEEILQKQKEITNFIDDTIHSEEYQRTGTIASQNEMDRRSTYHLQQLGELSEIALKERYEEVKALNKDMHTINELFKDADMMV
jgi:hypothetical protein